MLAASECPVHSSSDSIKEHSNQVPELDKDQSKSTTMLSVPQITSGEQSDTASDGNLSNQDSSSQTQGSGILVSIRKRMRRFLGASVESAILHKSMQDLSITSSVKDAGKFGTTTADHIRGSRVAKKTGGYSRSANSEASADFPSIKKDYEDSLIALTSLTDEEIQSVRDSWLILKAHIEKIGVIVFLGLFEEHSDFRDAFARFRGKQLVEITRDPALQAHGLRVLNVVDKLVGRLQKVEAIQDFILSLGSRHCKYVPSINLIPSVGEQLLEAIQPALEEQGMWTESTQRGWKAVLSYLTNAMRYGLARTPQTSLNIT